MTLLPVARVFRSVIRIKFFLSSLSFNLMPYFTHAYRFSKKCTRLFSPREVILLRGSLSIILPLLRSLIFPGRKHYRMKVLFPENAEKQSFENETR